MEVLSATLLPAALALQDVRWDFGGAPRAAVAVMRLRPLVGAAQLSLVSDLVVSYVVCLAGGTARNLLLSEPLALATTAQAFLPVFVAVWLLAVAAPSLLSFLPLRLATQSLNAVSRVRAVAAAVAAASVALGPANAAGIAVVGVAQASGQHGAVMLLRWLLGLPALLHDTAPLGFAVVSSLAAGVGLAATAGTPHHGWAVAMLTAWFVVHALLTTLIWGAPTPPAKDVKKTVPKKETKKD